MAQKAAQIRSTTRVAAPPEVELLFMEVDGLSAASLELRAFGSLLDLWGIHA